MLRRILFAALFAAVAVELSAAASLCDGAKHPIVVLPGIMASQINASYNGIAPGAPCIGRKRMHQIWPPSAKDILPTGFACWKYMIQLDYDGLAKTFGNNRGVKVHVESGGRSGTNYHLFQASYANLTSYLTHSMGYVVGKDLFGAPYDWRWHISGLAQSGQMAQLMARVENAVANNCGKKAIVLGHSMGGLVATAMLQRDPAWTQKYVKGLVTVSAPFGGTTDQAITVRMGAVEWNINEWVKNPMKRVAKELQAHVQDIKTAMEEEQLADVSIAAVRRVGKSVRRVGVLAGTLAHPAAAKLAAAADAAAQDSGDAEVASTAVATTTTSSRHLLHSDSVDATDAGAKPPGSAVVGISSGALPKPIHNMVKNYISSAFYKVTMGLPGLSMLLPYPSAYGAWRRIVVTRRKTYTASMMKRLMADMGDSVTQHAWAKVQELDKVLAAGPIPGVASYCMYGHLLDTTLTWNFPNIQENKPALTATPLVTTSGDGTVSVQSLKQCNKITTNITELGAYGHLEVLKNKAALAQLREVIREIASNPDSPPPAPATTTPALNATSNNTAAAKPAEPPRQPNWPSQTPDDQLANDPNAPHDSTSDGGDADSGTDDSSYADDELSADDYNETWELEVDGISSSGNKTASSGSKTDSSSSNSNSTAAGGGLKLIDPSDLKHAPFTKSLPTPNLNKDADGSSSSSSDGKPAAPEQPVSDAAKQPAAAKPADDPTAGWPTAPKEQPKADSDKEQQQKQDKQPAQAGGDAAAAEEEEDPDWVPAQALPLEYYQGHPELLAKPKNMRIYKWLVRQQAKAQEEEEERRRPKTRQQPQQRRADTRTQPDVAAPRDQGTAKQPQQPVQQPAPGAGAQNKASGGAGHAPDQAQEEELSEAQKLENLLLSLGEGDLVAAKKKEREEAERLAKEAAEAKERQAREAKEAKEKLEREKQEREAQAKLEKEQQLLLEQQRKEAQAAAPIAAPQQPEPAAAKKEPQQEQKAAGKELPLAGSGAAASSAADSAAAMAKAVDSWPSFKSSSAAADSAEAEAAAPEEEHDDDWEPAQGLSQEYLDKHPDLKWKVLLSKKEPAAAAAPPHAHAHMHASQAAPRRSRGRTPVFKQLSTQQDDAAKEAKHTSKVHEEPEQPGQPIIRRSVPKLSSIIKQQQQAEQQQQQQQHQQAAQQPAAAAPASAAAPVAATPQKPQQAAAPAPAPDQAAATTQPAAQQPAPKPAAEASSPAKPAQAAAPQAAAPPSAAPAKPQDAASKQPAAAPVAAAQKPGNATAVPAPSVVGAAANALKTAKQAVLSAVTSRRLQGLGPDHSKDPSTEALPPKALFVPKPVSVLAPDVNPLAAQQYRLVGAPRSVALGDKWAHEVLDVASGACLEALAKGQQAPPGCV